MAQRRAVEEGTQCAAEGCDRDADRWGPTMTKAGNPVAQDLAEQCYCPAHYQRLARKGTLKTERRTKLGSPTPTPTPTPDLPKVPLPKAESPTPEEGPKTPGKVLIGALSEIFERIETLEQKPEPTPEGTPKRIKVKIVTPAEVKDKEIPGPVHKCFADLLLFFANGEHVWAHGPAGSGKSEIGLQIANALDIPFYATGAVTHDSAFSGYIQPHNGEVLRTAFRDAWEHGGLFLADDCDRSDPQAMAWLHMALSQGIAAFPDGLVKKHPDFRCMLSANTVGEGADDGYMAAMAQDKALLNRFAFYEVGYDLDMERSLVTERYGDIGANWLEHCWDIREAAKNLQADVCISLRTILKGAHMIAAGLSQSKAEAAYCFPTSEEATARRVRREARQIKATREGGEK